MMALKYRTMMVLVTVIIGLCVIVTIVVCLKYQDDIDIFKLKLKNLQEHYDNLRNVIAPRGPPPSSNKTSSPPWWCDGFFIYDVYFNPPKLSTLTEGMSENVSVCTNLKILPCAKSPKNLTLTYKSENPTIATVFSFANENLSLLEVPGDFEINNKSLKTFYLNSSFTVNGLVLGKTTVSVSIKRIGENPESNFKLFKEYDVWVVRKNQNRKYIFFEPILIVIIITNVIIGAQLNLSFMLDIIKNFSKPMVLLLCHCFLLPAVFYVMTLDFFKFSDNSLLGLGLFILGVCPGGGASNWYTYILGGNLELSVAMSLVCNLVAVATMPFWILIFGALILHEDLRNFDQIILSQNSAISASYFFAVLVLPIFLGALMGHYWPKIAKKENLNMKALLMPMIFFFITFNVYSNFYVFRLMNWGVVLGALIFPWLGVGLVTLFALVFRLPLPDFIAFALELGIKCSSAAIMILQLSLQQPDADISSAFPILVTILLPIQLFIVVIVHPVMKRFSNKKQDTVHTGEIAVEET